MTNLVYSPSGLPIALCETIHCTSAGYLVEYLDRSGHILLPINFHVANKFDISDLPNCTDLVSASARKITSDYMQHVTYRYDTARTHAIAISRMEDYLPFVTLYAVGIGASITFVDWNDAPLNSLRNLGCESVTLVGAPSSFTSEILAELWRLQESSSIRIGIIPARTSDEFISFAIKRLFSNYLYQRYCGTIALVRDKSAGLDYQIGVTYESEFMDSDAARIRQPSHLLLLEFHAKETCAKFSKYVFCGLPQLSNIRNDESIRPDCAGGSPCAWNSIQRIKVLDIPTTHVFAVSCGSLRLANGLFSEKFGLGLNFFHSSARSLISPTRFTVASALHSGLLLDLAMSGERLGEVTYQINKWSQTAKIDAPSFVLLGDPNDKIDVDLAIGESVLRQAPLEPFTLKRDRPVAVPACTVVTQPVPYGLFKHVADRCPQIDGNEVFLDAIRSLDASVGLWPSLTYTDGHTYDHNKYRCFICDDTCVTYSRRAVDGSWRREVVNCPRCGLIADLPTQAYGSVAFSAPNSVRRSETMTLNSSCPADMRLDNVASCKFSLIQSDIFAWPEFGKQQILVHNNHNRFNASLSICVPNSAYRFVYWLRVSWLTKSNFYWMSRPLTLV